MTTHLIDANEVAILAGFTPNTIRRWARQGRIPSRNIGQRVRFVRAEVEQWIADLPKSVAS